MATRKQGVAPITSFGSKTTRRRFLGAATAVGVAASSGLTIFSRTAHAAGRVRVLCWPDYEEKPVIEEFEQKNDCKVEFKTYIGGEQMLQFFAQSPKGTFDAIISDAEYVQKLTAQKALDPLKPADFPNLADYHPKYRDFAPLRAPDSRIWAVPTRFSFYGLSYNTKYMTEDEAKTWNTLFLPKYKGKVALFDWYLPNMSNACLAVKPNNQTPYDISDAELGKVKEWLFKLRPQISVFSEQNQGLVNALINEDAWVRLDRARRGQHPLERGCRALRRQQEQGAGAQSLMIGPIDVADTPYYAAPAAGRHFAANLWPEQPAGLRSAYESYFRVMSALAADLMHLFALALELPEDYFDSSIDRHISRLRVRNYPAPQEAPVPGQLRAGAHSDYGSLTILKTEDRPGGLQVLGKTGEWLDVSHIPGCFIVNIGDMMARWTIDRWVSTLHRVVNPPPDRTAESRRQSLVFFHNPNYDAVVSCLPGCASDTNPPKYPPTTSGGHLREKFLSTQQAIDYVG